MSFLKNYRSLRTKATLLLLLPAAALAGCQATVNTRWAQTQDSPESWETTMTNIPIDVHGDIPGASADQLANLVNVNTTRSTIAVSQAGQSSLAKSRRIELYIDANQLPVANSYCEAAPTLQTAQATKSGAQMVGALCDGPRLVATEVVHLDSRTLAVAQVPHAIDKFKSKMLAGLATNPNIVPYQYEY